MASKNKYVIRYTVRETGVRVREYFTSKREAEAFARERGLPKSQIKAIAAAAFILLLAGCTDAERANLFAYGSSATVTCYSGGEPVYEAASTGKVMSLDNAGVAFRDKQTGRYVRAYADCIVREND